jgi:hypothetical protein
MRHFTFNKENDSRWYVDLPEWDGDKEDLEMVMGADTMLDILSQGDPSVGVAISEDYYGDHKFVLQFKEEYDGGAWYTYQDKLGLHTFDLWLCFVTKFVFDGRLPELLYCA